MDKIKHQDNENVTVNFTPEEEKSDWNVNTIHLEWNWDHKNWSWNVNIDTGCNNSEG